MISQDRKSYPNMSPVDRPSALDSTMQTNSRRAVWSALIAFAIVAVMFVAFYDISIQLDRTHTTAGAPAVTGPQTTGQGAR
jgi:hypothetical protein